jgi:hypothetical protein
MRNIERENSGEDHSAIQVELTMFPKIKMHRRYTQEMANSHSLQRDEQALVMEQLPRTAPSITLTQLINTIHASDQDANHGESQETHKD